MTPQPKTADPYAAAAFGLLDYDPHTGLFKWRSGHWAGKAAGSINGRGYVNIPLLRRTFKAHRIAWLFENGGWPPLSIDHINGEKADNRILNLRLCTQSQNTANSRKSAANTSGFKGVSFDIKSRRWRATITTAGVTNHLGFFPTPEEAHSHYAREAIARRGEFART